MTREEAIAKIKKLQALKEGAAKIGSAGEAAQASKIIDKLQAQFGITMEEVYSYAAQQEEPQASEEPQDNANDGGYYQDDYQGGYQETYEEEKAAPTAKQIKKNRKTIHRNLRRHLMEILEEDKRLRHSMSLKKLRKRMSKDLLNYCGSVLLNERIQSKCNYFGIVLSEIVDEEYAKALTQMEYMLNDFREEEKAVNNFNRKLFKAKINTRIRNIKENAKKITFSGGVAVALLIGARMFIVKGSQSLKQEQRRDHMAYVEKRRAQEEQEREAKIKELIEKERINGYNSLTAEEKKILDSYYSAQEGKNRVYEQFDKEFNEHKSHRE